MAIDKKEVSSWFEQLQNDICTKLERLDGQAAFGTDRWRREAGGGGITRVIESGALIEKGGVNFSEVHGKVPENMLKTLEIEQDSDQDSTFFATGVSIVLHPINPMMPIIHMNVRYLEVHGKEMNLANWFGGGIDLSPHYIFKEDAQMFHQKLKDACDKHDSSYYAAFKKWADDYFFVKHRKETRGVGGIFFDRLSETTDSRIESIFDFVKEVGNSFYPIYEQLANKRRNEDYTDNELGWQALRRGRYTEFNLIYDRGTKFGLETGGRVESILMSLPPHSKWTYNHAPPAGSPEENTLRQLRKDVDWISPD